MPFKIHIIKGTSALFFVLIIGILTYSCKNTGESTTDNQAGISIYKENPFYWSYNGKPILLLGGTKEDNIFQIDDLEEHLELLESVGGNYIRCTLSSRDPGNLKPYLKDARGLYDLNRPNPEYWQKLVALFEISQKLDIIVQLEIWATYDFYWGEFRWSDNPFNPKLNSNYTVEQSRLPDSIAYPAQSEINPFFTSVPGLKDNELLRKYQEQFVDKVLEITLSYDNVLYCIDNETNAHYLWGIYWSNYIRTKALSHGKKIFVTEMWDSWDPTNGAVPHTKIQHPDLGGWYAEYTNPDLHNDSNYSYSLKDTLSYNYMDIANNNAQDGQTHYDTGLWIRNEIEKSEKIRPINNVKIYGADVSQLWSGSIREGQQRFWRNIFAGHAAVRFHRPDAGIGLSKLAQINIRSMRMLTEKADIFSFRPANEILGDRKSNEAYCMTNGSGEYILYMPTGGVVKLDIPEQDYSMETMRIIQSFWMEPKRINFPGVVAAPHDEPWVFLIKALK
ncbi:MAG: hypothetical protein ACR2MM_07180 [Flavobacteriaceae bacterium]